MSQPTVWVPGWRFRFRWSAQNAILIYSIDLVRRGWLESVPGPSFRANVAFLGCPADPKLRRSRGNVLPVVTGCAPQDIPPSPNGVRNSGVKLCREIRIWMTQDPAA